LETRNEPRSALSFFSGHAATVTAITVSTFAALRRRNPGKWWPWIMLGAGLAASSFVAAGRVMAGQHFPTDVIAGMVTGACAGIAVTELHGSPVKAVASGSTIGLAFFWK
jgi:membrane-associated phospholipid phosphatase